MSSRDTFTVLYSSVYNPFNTVEHPGTLRSKRDNSSSLQGHHKICKFCSISSFATANGLLLFWGFLITIIILDM